MRDLKADREQLKRTIEIFEYQQATLDTLEDEIVPQIDLESQRLYTLIGLGELLTEHGVEWLDRAIRAEIDLKRQRDYSKMVEDERNKFCRIARELARALKFRLFWEKQIASPEEIGGIEYLEKLISELGGVG